MTTSPTIRVPGGVRRGGRVLSIVLPAVMLLSAVAPPVAPPAGPAARVDAAAAGRRPLEVIRAPAGTAIPNRYIVRLRPGGLTADVVIPLDVRPDFVYQQVISGFTANMSPEQIGEVLSHPEVAAVEEDGVVRAFGPGPAPVAGRGAPDLTTSWGLDRIDQRSLPLNGRYDVTHTGAGVTAYIVDSGIDPANKDFTGRLVPGFSAVTDQRGTGDCLGHGTSVAGIVGGTSWGVARKVKLAPVRVLGCDGSGAYSGVIAGLDWIAKNAARPAVVNVSLGGPKSPSVNEAANGLAREGIFVAAAAGNAFSNACDVSPASAPGILTVGASTRVDGQAIFSNTGPCVDVFAPGLAVTTSKAGGGSRVGNGTSFAAPYATGVAALYKQARGDAQSAVLENWLVREATSDELKGIPENTSNKLLYTGGL
ncbi:serine protease [Sphaerisporangium rufum]|uniref:Serine protease n=1 Tax=Sphaerisporangium rufum TaxID=1381558 RepID=A0A919R7T9_9ACTN|nr:S8 family peptidase [Sphaerisporangium rufum]GII79996.1 serine protease [Sphaerisporangium rufum]